VSHVRSCPRCVGVGGIAVVADEGGEVEIGDAAGGVPGQVVVGEVGGGPLVDDVGYAAKVVEELFGFGDEGEGHG
jgi:hypothetical protein